VLVHLIIHLVENNVEGNFSAGVQIFLGEGRCQGAQKWTKHLAVLDQFETYRHKSM